MSRLGPTGLTQLLTDIKTWITTKLGNYVTTDTTQTVTGKKYFTNSTTQVNSVNTFTGSTLFIDTSASAPRGSFPETAYRVGRIYIGDGTSYNGAWFIIDPTIDTNRAYYRMVTTNPDNTDSARFSICWDSRYEGVRRRRNISMGDLLPSGASTYNLGESGNAWQDAYINKIHGISDYTNLKTNTFNVNTTLTHGGSGRRVILAMGAITLTVPAPEEGSWFLIKAVNGLVTLNLASNVTVTGITAGVFSGPIHLQPNESILLCYYSSTTYNATISTIRRSGVVGRTGNVPSENPKHWFKIAENYVTATYRDPFICLRVFEGTTGNTIGTLCAHCRIDNTVGVVATYNCYLQWQDAGSGIDLSKYALTTNETSGTGVTIALWCTLTGGYSSLKFEVVSECGQSDQLGNPEWVLTRRRQADGDLAELLDTDFTKIVYSTLTTLKNDTTGKAANVTGTVAIANGGTGATTRLNAVKNLTNESVGTPTHFLAITTNWGKAGYTTVAQAKTVLGITGDIVSHNASEFLTTSGTADKATKDASGNVITSTYVNLTGDQSISGLKSYSKHINIAGDQLGNEQSVNGNTCLYLTSKRDTVNKSGIYVTKFRQNVAQGSMGASDVIYLSYDVLENEVRTNGVLKQSYGNWSNDVPGTLTLYSEIGTRNLGYSAYPWTSAYVTNLYIDGTQFVPSEVMHLAGSETVTGTKIFNGDKIVITQGNGYRMVGNTDGGASGYGVFQRVDGSSWYLMVTAQNDALGSWTSARPASMNLSTGVLSINGNAATATQFSANTTVTLTGDATGTSAGSKKGWSVPVTLANSGVTAGSYGPSTAVSPAHGGTFSVPYVTVDAKGRVTAASSITITLPSDSNTDTLMTQNVSTTDNTYPILLCATANATSNQGAKTGIFGSGVKVNPKTSIVSAKGFSGIPTGNTYVNAVKDGGALVNSQATSWGAIWRAPTKDYQVAGATWSNTNNNVYICYSVTNANANAGTNTMAKSLIWAADTGTLTTTTFSGALSGNASTATEFSANKNVTLTGDVTGTASSKAGWSVTTTLANSGVTAGTYGPSADVTGNNNATISVPEITVDAKGRVTSVTNRTLTCKNNTYNVYNKTLTIQKNGTNVATFTSNSNTDVTANITVPTKVSELTNDSGYLTSHQSLSNYVTLNTAQEITNIKTFKDANTVVKRTDIEAGNTLPSADKLARNIFLDKNGKELGSIYYYKNTSGDTGLCLRAGDWFSESEGVYSLNASGTNRRAELVLYTNSRGNCCIKPNGLFSAHIKPLDSSVCLAEYGKPFGVAYVNQVRFTNATLQVDVDITATEEHSIGFFGKNNGPLSYITFQKRPSFKDRVAIRVQTSSSAYKSYDFDATCFYPESSNSVDIGSTTNIFKNIYCNNYYKGTTAFGDIVTHNASEFLTAHQSLANYVTLNGAQTISGIKTISTHLRFSSANTRGTAPSANEERDLIDYKDSAGNRISLFETMYYTDKSSKTSIYAYKTTAATGGNIGSIGIGCDASGNVYTYAPTPSSLDNSTKIATTAFVYNTAAKHLAAATNIYVAKVATGNGSGSNTSNYMSLADLRTYLATVHMHSSTSDMNGSYNLQILFKAGDSFGNATFDATKMPGVRNLILNTSTGTNSTVGNYSTNSPTFGNITVTGDISVTMRNLNCTGRISSQYGAYVSIDTYMGISSLQATNYGYLNVAKNMVINVCDAHTDYLFSAMNNGILAMWPGATVTINFRQQCYYTRSLFYAASNGTAWIGYSSFKLTGTEPMAVWGGSGTLTGTSETAAATVQKAVTLASGQTFTLTTNATAKVKFTVDNTAANPTLNIGGTGAKPIYWNNAPVQATMLMKNITYDVKYNGSQFVIQNAVKRLTNNDFGVFRSNGNYNQTYNSGSWNFTGWTLYYGTGIENSNWRGSHIGNIQQNVSTSNNTYPVLISGTANATANTSTAPCFASGVKINPSTSTITATTFSGALTGNVTGNCSGSSGSCTGNAATATTAGNVTGTVAIANGGTGATTRLNAVKALTNESVGTPTHFLAITTNYAKAGYTTVAQAKTVLGITGDIVSHNASEFLTSHQSLSSCVKNSVTNTQTIKSTGITRGTAPSSTQTFGIAFSDNNNKSIGNVYGQYATDKSTYVGLYAYKGTTTANGDNASVRVGYDASGKAYTYAPTPATADNSTQIATTAFVKAQGYLTSHQSLANYVTTNTDQSISGIKSHSKHISILGDYIGNESSTNGRSCLYLKANRDTDGKSGLYVTKFRQNVAQGSMGNSDVVFLSHDILENGTRTNAGFVESYSNWTNNVPGGISVYSTIATRNLGTSAKPWTNAYITNLNLNGNAFDPASTSGNIGDVVFASAYYSDITGTLSLNLTVSGNALHLAGFNNDTLVWNADAASLSGTWKLLGLGKPITTTDTTLRTGLWKRIL